MLSQFSLVQLFVTLWMVTLQDPLSIGFTGKNIGVGCHALLHGIFLTQGWSLHPYISCTGRWVLYHQHHQSCSLQRFWKRRFPSPHPPRSLPALLTGMQMHQFHASNITQLFSMSLPTFSSFYKNINRIRFSTTPVLILT